MSKIKWLIQPNYVWMTVLQLLLPVFLFLGLQAAAEWYWWVMTFVFYFLYLCIGNNVGMHRYYCHRYFEMHKPVEWIVAWCATMACLGSPLSYANVHVVHHKFADTKLDPHGRQRGWKSVLYWFHKHLYPCDMIFTRNIVKLTKQYKILHEYYWLWVFGMAIVMYLIGGWNVLLFCWLIPASLTLWAVAFVLLLQHDDKGPSNTRIYQWFGFAETWHKNHHDFPSLDNHADAGEKDWTYILSRLLAKK